MSKYCPIMKRLKKNSEIRNRTYLLRRIPVIMRLDGQTFKSYTKHLVKPFDEGLIEDMQQTAIYLCQNIQGAKCAYVQSDEISILITDYDTFDTQAWFDYEKEKMCSISAGYAVGRFNQLRLVREAREFGDLVSSQINGATLANFDSRVSNYSKEEVANYFLARQKDAVKNSISMLAQSLYSHSALNKMNGNQKQEMCFQKGINWNDLHFSKKRGSFIVKNTYINGKLLLPFESTHQNPENSVFLYENNYYNWFKCENQNVDDGGLRHNDIDYYLDKPIEKPIIRSKWEVVETPLTFTHKDFEKWL